MFVGLAFKLEIPHVPKIHVIWGSLRPHDCDEDGGDHQKDEDKHGYDLSPHETSVIVKPTVVVVAVLSNHPCNQINAKTSFKSENYRNASMRCIKVKIQFKSRMSCLKETAGRTIVSVEEGHSNHLGLDKHQNW